MQLYSLAQVYINGSLLAEEASVTIDRDTKALPVMTVAKGFSGMSPGAPMMSIQVENGVPAAGFELNPGQFMSISGGLQVVEVSIFAAGQLLTTKGFVVSDNFQHAVNQEAKLKFSITAQFADWSTF